MHLCAAGHCLHPWSVHDISVESWGVRCNIQTGGLHVQNTGHPIHSGENVYLDLMWLSKYLNIQKTNNVCWHQARRLPLSTPTRAPACTSPRPPPPSCCCCSWPPAAATRSPELLRHTQTCFQTPSWVETRSYRTTIAMKQVRNDNLRTLQISSRVYKRIRCLLHCPNLS